MAYQEVRIDTLDLVQLKHFSAGYQPNQPIIKDISLTIQKTETLGLVGESGSGKSTLARALMKLVPITEGTLNFEGLNLTSKLSKVEEKSYRQKMQIVFQDVSSSLSPRFTCRDILMEPFRIHLYDTSYAESRINEMLVAVGLSKEFLSAYPHELSGGQKQRISIARALMLNPKFVILDESTAALDVSVQWQIVELLKKLQDELKLTYLFITHDLSLLKHVADRIAVMYQGQIVELAQTEELFTTPQHPYTQKLLESIITPNPLIEKMREFTFLDASIELPKKTKLHQLTPTHFVAVSDE